MCRVGERCRWKPELQSGPDSYVPMTPGSAKVLGGNVCCQSPVQTLQPTAMCHEAHGSLILEHSNRPCSVVSSGEDPRPLMP